MSRNDLPLSDPFETNGNPTGLTGWICSIDMGKAVHLDNVYVVPPHADARMCPPWMA
ncbi:MAG TPA: hypothetical protein VK629_02235 [Steroidobacteraceae bacterium]|nr:hypothetical protein [Steroidobacteraceae bacterium]